MNHLTAHFVSLFTFVCFAAAVALMVLRKWPESWAANARWVALAMLAVAALLTVAFVEAGVAL